MAYKLLGKTSPNGINGSSVFSTWNRVLEDYWKRVVKYFSIKYVLKSST